MNYPPDFLMRGGFGNRRLRSMAPGGLPLYYQLLAAGGGLPMLPGMLGRPSPFPLHLLGRRGRAGGLGQTGLPLQMQLALAELGSGRRRRRWMDLDDDEYDDYDEEEDEDPFTEYLEYQKQLARRRRLEDVMRMRSPLMSMGGGLGMPLSMGMGPMGMGMSGWI